MLPADSDSHGDIPIILDELQLLQLLNLDEALTDDMAVCRVNFATGKLLRKATGLKSRMEH